MAIKNIDIYYCFTVSTIVQWQSDMNKLKQDWLVKSIKHIENIQPNWAMSLVYVEENSRNIYKRINSKSIIKLQDVNETLFV